MDFALTDSQELIRKEVAALSRTFSLEYWLEKDTAAEYPSDFVKAFADNGWLGVMIPEEFGGAGLGVTEAGLMLHEICASGAGTSGASPIHFYVFPPTPIIKYGIFINTILDFVIVAFAIFLVIRAINKFRRKQEAAPPPSPPVPSAEERLLTEIRDLLRAQSR